MPRLRLSRRRRGRRGRGPGREARRGGGRAGGRRKRQPVAAVREPWLALEKHSDSEAVVSPTPLSDPRRGAPWREGPPRWGRRGGCRAARALKRGSQGLAGGGGPTPRRMGESARGSRNGGHGWEPVLELRQRDGTFSPWTRPPSTLSSGPVGPPPRPGPSPGPGATHPTPHGSDTDPGPVALPPRL